VSDDDTPERSLGLWLRCAKCRHCWIGAYYPTEVSVLCKATKGARCPKCATPKPFLAKQEAGRLLEPTP
jgi:hypothetical protein